MKLQFYIDLTNIREEHKGLIYGLNITMEFKITWAALKEGKSESWVLGVDEVFGTSVSRGEEKGLNAEVCGPQSSEACNGDGQQIFPGWPM